MRAALLLALLLAACSNSESPQAQCERQAMNDPAVQQAYLDAYGSYTQPWQPLAPVIVAKREAVLNCMRKKGLALPGGVQPVVIVR